MGGPSGSIIGTTYPPQTLSVDGNITAKQLGFIKPKVYYIEYDFKLVDLSEKQISSPIRFSSTGVVAVKENQILKDLLLMKYSPSIGKLLETTTVTNLHVHVKELNRWQRE